jgi:N6-L-threonylcarbamoyladenine synthase
VQASGDEVSVPDVAASFQKAVVDVQVAKTLAAAQSVGVDRVFMCGGVAANSGLRGGLEEACLTSGLTLHVPPLELCTDNAAMVAACGTAMVRRGLYLDISAAPDPNLPLVA